MTVRVNVLSGDGTTDLGEGNYIGDADTYAFRLPDGGLVSFDDPESKPTPQQIEQTQARYPGARLECIPGNPKIVLDSGKTVYGCQVWWNMVEDKDNQQKE